MTLALSRYAANLRVWKATVPAAQLQNGSSAGASPCRLARVVLPLR